MSRVEPQRNVYIGHRYVPLLVGEWDNSIEYEGLSIVTYKGASYTSKKRTPPGIKIENEEFWVLTGNYNAQIEYYRQDVARVQQEIRDTKADLESQMRDARKHVDDSVQNLTGYVNDTVDDLTRDVNNSITESERKVNQTVEDLTGFVNDTASNLNDRMTNQETTISDNMETLQNALYNEIDNVGTTTFTRGNQNTVVEIDSPYKILEIEYNSDGLLTAINEAGARKNIRTTVNRAGNGEVQSYDREEI